MGCVLETEGLILGERATGHELIPIIQAEQLGQFQMDNIHGGKPVYVELWLGGSAGGIVLMAQQPETSMLGLVSMLRAKGGFIEKNVGKPFRIEDIAQSNGKPALRTVIASPLDLKCLRVQLGCIDRNFGAGDDYRARAIIHAALRRKSFVYKRGDSLFG